MKYALNIGEDNRILSATFEKFATQAMPIVSTLPDGDITDYLYVNSEYIYDPLPKPPEPEPQPTSDEILDALLGVTE